jgi:TolB-like protein
MKKVNLKRVAMLFVVLNFAFVGYTQELLVAVTDFTAKSGYSEEELENVTELFAGILRETKKVKVLTRSQWTAILKEHTFQRGGLVADTEIRKLGEALSANAVITGNLMKLGNSNILNLSLLDVESGELLSTARKTFGSLDELLKLLPALVSDMIKLMIPSPFVGKWTTTTLNSLIYPGGKSSTGLRQVAIMQFNANNTINVIQYEYADNWYDQGDESWFEMNLYIGKGIYSLSADNTIEIDINLDHYTREQEARGRNYQFSEYRTVNEEHIREIKTKTKYSFNPSFNKFTLKNGLKCGFQAGNQGDEDFFYTTFVRE